ncbi:MAG: PD40 domain-containing protein [Chloroflexi bacterium]|nr:PD40 domain-containing protein [Chloroflexota bacterium]
MRLQLKGRNLRVAAPILVGAVMLIVGVFAACGGGDPAGTPTPSPAPSAGLSPSPDVPTPTPLPPLEPSSYRFLYSEFGVEEDLIWSIDPADPSDRVQLAAVPHGAGWGIKPALSPDGKKIAYNAMPDDGLLPGTDAEARILDLESGETSVVAEGVDLRTVPRWSPDGGLLFLRRNVGEDVTVILVDLREPEDEEESEEEKPPPIRTVLRQHESDVQTYTPLGFDPDEATLYFTQLQGGTELGSFLGRYAPATGEAVATATAIVEATATASAGTPAPTPSPPPTPPALPGDVFLFLSDQIARDLALSPDASRVAFLVQSLAEGRFVFRVHIADIKAKQVAPLDMVEGLAAGDQLSPIWHPDGDKVSFGQLPSGADPGRVAIVSLDGGEPIFLPPPEQGFDQPLSWSPDGKFLAVRSSSGDSIGNPGLPRLVFVSPAGQRPAAPEGAEFEPVGWVIKE